MRTQKGTTSLLARHALPEGVLFEEEDGFLWLEKEDLSRFQALTGLAFDCQWVGFDKCDAMPYIVAFLRRGVHVGIRHGDQVRMLRRKQLPRRVVPLSTPVLVRPELILDQRDLERLRRASGRKHWRLRDSFESWRTKLCRSDCSSFGSDTAIYVYEVAPGMYEVNWSLSQVSEESFQALALAAYLGGETIPCLLVSPRVTAKAHASRRKALAPLTYGQLRLAI